MKIRSITPIRVSAGEVKRRQARYDRLAPQGWKFTVENLTFGAPEQLATEADIQASERLVLELATATSPEEFDAVMPDCVLDPSLDELERSAPVRVLGIGRLGAHHLAASGRTFGVLVRNSAIGESFTAMIERYGLTYAYRGAFVMDLDVAAVADSALWNAAASAQISRARSSNVTTLINGCSAVDSDSGDSDIRIVDPLELAFAAASAGQDHDPIPDRSYQTKDAT